MRSQSNKTETKRSELRAFIRFGSNRSTCPCSFSFLILIFFLSLSSQRKSVATTTTTTTIRCITHFVRTQTVAHTPTDTRNEECKMRKIWKIFWADGSWLHCTIVRRAKEKSVRVWACRCSLFVCVCMQRLVTTHQYIYEYIQIYLYICETKS